MNMIEAQAQKQLENTKQTFLLVRDMMLQMLQRIYSCIGKKSAIFT